ncbi:MAG: hypothetical protein IT393_07150 [Nitrospirae bacterium]|nr:hypothetical protein [Nitrospirota bacterium]
MTGKDIVTAAERLRLLKRPETPVRRFIRNMIAAKHIRGGYDAVPERVDRRGSDRDSGGVHICAVCGGR